MMDEPNNVSKVPGALSRRRLFGLTGGVVGAGLLGACQVSTETDPSGGGGAGGGSEADLKIPDSGAKIPEGDVTFQWMDSGDLKALFEEPVFEAYQKKHPNITIDYQDSSWERINEAIPLAVRNKSAPDVFALPQNVPVQTAVNENWVQSIDDIVPDIEKWKSGFPEGMFLEGIHVFGGKTYTWPLTGSKRLRHMLMFDPGYLEKAGYDPIAERFTWDTFREAAKKVTKQGKGDYYGLIASSTSLGDVALSLARFAGMRSIGDNSHPPIDMKTGQYNATAPEFEAAFELLLAIKADGSFFPGFLGLGDADSRARMPNRVAGMIFDGPWDIPEWQRTNPDYEFDIAMPPTGNDKQKHYFTYHENGVNFVYVAAGSEQSAIAGDLFHYMGSLEGQTQLVLLSEGNLTSVMPEANKAAEKKRDQLDPLALKAIGYADQLMRIGPQVQARNPDMAKVLLELKPVSPTLPDLGEGILAGEITNIRKALKSFEDEAERNLEEAIAAARKKGAEITRDAWAFGNWDPSEDYTAADYEALGK